jgi:hypothetical protein
MLRLWIRLKKILKISWKREISLLRKLTLSLKLRKKYFGKLNELKRIILPLLRSIKLTVPKSTYKILQARSSLKSILKKFKTLLPTPKPNYLLEFKKIKQPKNCKRSKKSRVRKLLRGKKRTNGLRKNKKMKLNANGLIWLAKMAIKPYWRLILKTLRSKNSNFLSPHLQLKGCLICKRIRSLKKVRGSLMLPKRLSPCLKKFTLAIESLKQVIGSCHQELHLLRVCPFTAITLFTLERAGFWV